MRTLCYDQQGNQHPDRESMLAACEAYKLKSCEGILRAPWEPLTARDHEVIAALRQRTADWRVHAAWTDFLVQWTEVACQYLYDCNRHEIVTGTWILRSKA